MITVLILVLLLLTGLLFLLKSKKLAIISFVLSIILYVDIGYGWFSAMLLNHLQSPFKELTQPEWGGRNAIVLLGAGTTVEPSSHAVITPALISYGRILEAARLYFSCQHSGNRCTLIISGGDPEHHGQTEAEVYQKSLLNLGVKSSDIILEAKSLNTFQNAKFTSAIIESGQFNQIYLVTSAVHMKRSLLYFLHFGVVATAAPADYIATVPAYFPLGYNFVIADRVMHEYLGIVRYYVYNFFGWNPKPNIRRD